MAGLSNDNLGKRAGHHDTLKPRPSRQPNADRDKPNARLCARLTAKRQSMTAATMPRVA